MLKTVIESTDGLDDAVKSLYTEADGKFVLQIEGVDAHPEVVNLSSSYKAVKADRNAIREERDALRSSKVELPEGFTIEKWEKLKDGKPDEAAQLKLREEYEAKIAGLESKLETTQATSRKNALDRDLTDALTEVGVTNPTFAKAARGMLSDDVQIGEDGKPFIDTDMGRLALIDHVKRWASGEGKDFVTPPKGGGGKGGDGSGGSKKWSEMTSGDKAELFRSDPTEYERVRDAAT